VEFNLAYSRVSLANFAGPWNLKLVGTVS